MSGPDTAPDSGSDVPDTGDTADTTVEIDIDQGQPCDAPSDCTDPAPLCHDWECIARLCEAVPRTGGSCDDGDVCSGSDVCELGECVAGPEVECDTATECGRPICDSSVGCTAAIVEGGVCEMIRGAAWGTCDGIRMAPIDECLADGRCTDVATTPNTPLAKSLVVGDWFMAIQMSSAETTVAGAVEFEAAGS